MRKKVVLLPGMLCDKTVWEDVITALDDVADCRVINADGGSSIYEIATEIARQIDSPVALLGHSLGGRVALQVQRMYPQNVTHLGLFNASASGHLSIGSLEHEVKLRLDQLENIHFNGLAAFAGQWAKDSFSKKSLDNYRLIEAFKKMVTAQRREMFETQALAGLARPDMMSWLRDISCPTLVIGGQEEFARPPETHRAIASAIPRAKCAIIAGTAHMTVMEAPETVASLIRELLSCVVNQDVKKL